jgi:hypothetical protein
LSSKKPTKFPIYLNATVAVANGAIAVLYFLDARWGLAWAWVAITLAWIAITTVSVSTYRMRMDDWRSAEAPKARFLEHYPRWPS